MAFLGRSRTDAAQIARRSSGGGGGACGGFDNTAGG